MSKIAICCVALAASLTGMAASQAREITFWNHTFTVDDGPAAAPAQPQFNAVVAHPKRYRHEHRLMDLDQAR